MYRVSHQREYSDCFFSHFHTLQTALPKRGSSKFPFQQSAVHKCHIHKVSPQCEYAHVASTGYAASSVIHTCHICKVSLQCECACELSHLTDESTCVTFEWFFSSEYQHMYFQMLLMSKLQSTYVTFVGFLSSVSAHM